MYWIIIVIIAAILSIHEGRKEKKHPGYRSWMDDDSPEARWRRRHNVD